MRDMTNIPYKKYLSFILTSIQIDVNYTQAVVAAATSPPFVISVGVIASWAWYEFNNQVH